MRRVGLLALLVAACGAPAPAPAVRTDTVDPTATAAGPDDPVVARVDGRPIYGSCVAAQAAAHRLDRRAALDECVAFELLAGAATARGLTRDADVLAARHDAAATRMIDREFTDRYQQWRDLPASVTEPIMAQSADRLVRPESRASFLVRLEVAQAQAGSPLDLAAGSAVKAAYDTIATRVDLFGPDVQAAVERAVAADPSLRDLKLVGVRPDPTTAEAGLREYYRKALFAIPTIGAIAPPQRSPWGWDLILWTDVRHPPPRTRDQLAAELFAPVRLRWFGTWTTALARPHHIAMLAEPPS